MTKKSAAKSLSKTQSNGSSLDSRYGEIGISAVAAALQYRSGSQSSAATKAAPRPSRLLDEIAEIAA